MAGNYSPKQFFRKVSNKFLIDYFEQKNINFELDLYAVNEHNVEPIFAAFKKLDELTRKNIESDFQRVHSMASEVGIVALTEEAKEFENFHFIEEIKTLNSLHNKAMFAFLDSPEYWQAASLLFQAKKLSSSAWRMVNSLPDMQIPFMDIDIKLLSKAVGEYFFDKEGRGKRCKIEHYKRGKLDYFYAFPEDFAKSEVEWIKDTLQDIPHTMAFEIIFVYCQTEASLSLYAKRTLKIFHNSNSCFLSIF